jgi:hypothetical protein
VGDASPESWANGLDQLAFKGGSQVMDVPFCHRKVYALLLDNLIHIHLVVESAPIHYVTFNLLGIVLPKDSIALDLRMSITNRHSVAQLLLGF